ncbi:MAG: DUF3883 domain-containing protein [Lewinella sp.]|uniref:DUF3883 domain-containing protein n=1 Tax=Lewinella sp. TaxID=2004506 RepID=UPI003D6C0B44
MNTEIRKLLIDRAHARSRGPISYGDVARALGITTATEADRSILSRVLGEIAEFEHQQDRPLLSAIVTYSIGSKEGASKSETEDNTHGPGLYNIAAELGFGSKRQLQQDFFGITEMNRCFDFWQNEENYRNYRVVRTPGMPFFTKEEIAGFSAIVDQPYETENPAHQDVRQTVIDPLWDKTIHWANSLVEQFPDFKQKSKRSWTELRRSGQIFKHYTWARIFHQRHDGRKIYFTVGVDGNTQELVYKLDYQVIGRSSNLDEQQRQLIQSERPIAARWVGIHQDQLLSYDWDKLIAESSDFIRKYLEDYERLYRLIENSENLTGELSDKNQLIPTDPPEGWGEEPTYEPDFKPTSTDYEEKAREQKLLGDQGEELVISFEKKRLRHLGCEELAEQVTKAADGEGFDIRSFDKNGDPVFIEIKTTRQGIDTPFYLSRNELAFAEKNASNYCIYRLYNYDSTLNTARYYKLQNVVESVILQPTEYLVFPKRDLLDKD